MDLWINQYDFHLDYWDIDFGGPFPGLNPDYPDDNNNNNDNNDDHMPLGPPTLPEPVDNSSFLL